MTQTAADDRDLVGPYRVIKPIGAGGSARIDLARIDRAYGFQRHVVVKRPLEHLRGDARVAASLRREARIGGQLHHPNLVAILDAGVHDGYDYLVLEYVHGAALRSAMQGDAPGRVRDLPLGAALAIVSDVARGLHEAHELTDEHGAPLGLVHRDVSPGNILLGVDGTVKLADFGIAVETRVATLSGSMHGTVTYMAPEQCRGHAFDRRADVFSLGVILYELVTGARLFWAENDVASLHRVLSGTVPRPRQVRPELPGPLEDIVLTAVAHDARRRFPTALELATAVERFAAGAGEVLGARWIARSVGAIVGAAPAPWVASAADAAAVAAAAAVQVAASDGSLVDLIAASGDEPAEPGFGAAAGDPDDDAADAAQTLALGAVRDDAAPPPAPGDAPRAANPQQRGAQSTPSAPLRRRRGVIAALSAAAIGIAVIAVVAARGAAPPTTITLQPVAPDHALAEPPNAAPSTAAGPSAPSSAVVPSISPTAGATGQAAPPPSGAAVEPPIAGDDQARSRDAAPAPSSGKRTGHTTPTPRPAGDHHATAGKRRRPPPQPPHAAPASGDPTARVDATAHPAPTPGAGSAAPQPARPQTDVEWKPSLLLPTDGSNGNPRR